MGVPASKPTAEQESERIGRSWYVPPKPPPPTGWLVFSEDFVLGVLQGCYVRHQQPRKTRGWLALAAVLRSVMAVAQAVLMGLSYVPLVNTVIEMLVGNLPRGAAGYFGRACYWKTKLKHLGQDTLLERGISIWGAGSIEIGSCCHLDTCVRMGAGESRLGQHGFIRVGDYSHLGPRCHIAGRGGVEIGDLVSIEAGVHAYSATNTILNPQAPGQLISVSHMAPSGFQQTFEAPLRIGDYATIGFGALLMPGATVGMGAIVHPHTQVTGKYPPFSNVVGPGRAKRSGWRRPARIDPRCPEAVEAASQADSKGGAGSTA